MNKFWTWFFRVKITIKIILFIHYKFDLPIVHDVTNFAENIYNKTTMDEFRYFYGNLSEKVRSCNYNLGPNRLLN